MGAVVGDQVVVGATFSAALGTISIPLRITLRSVVVGGVAALAAPQP